MSLPSIKLSSKKALSSFLFVEMFIFRCVVNYRFHHPMLIDLRIRLFVQTQGLAYHIASICFFGHIIQVPVL